MKGGGGRTEGRGAPRGMVRMRRDCWGYEEWPRHTGCRGDLRAPRVPFFSFLLFPPAWVGASPIPGGDHRDRRARGARPPPACRPYRRSRRAPPRRPRAAAVGPPTVGTRRHRPATVAAASPLTGAAAPAVLGRRQQARCLPPQLPTRHPHPHLIRAAAGAFRRAVPCLNAECVPEAVAWPRTWTLRSGSPRPHLSATPSPGPRLATSLCGRSSATTAARRPAPHSSHVAHLAAGTRRRC